MESIKQTIDNALHNYNPDEFFPVFCDGRLDNRAEFVAYKAERAMEHMHRAIDAAPSVLGHAAVATVRATIKAAELTGQDRKSTRLNSSHSQISYAVFCLK